MALSAALEAAEKRETTIELRTSRPYSTPIVDEISPLKRQYPSLYIICLALRKEQYKWAQAEVTAKRNLEERQRVKTVLDEYDYDDDSDPDYDVDTRAPKKNKKKTVKTPIVTVQSIRTPALAASIAKLEQQKKIAEEFYSHTANIGQTMPRTKA